MWSTGGGSAVSTRELVETAFAALSELAGRRPPGSPAECLELAECLGRGLDLGEAALATLLGVADRAGQASAEHYAGTKGWLQVALGMRAGRAEERLALTRRLGRLPRTAALLRAGELSYGYASKIAEAVAHLDDEDCAKAEEILLGLAEQGIPPTTVARYGLRIRELIAERDGKERPPEDARRGDRSWLTMAKSLNGSSLVKGLFSPTLTALVRDRLGPLAKPAGPDDTRDHAQRLADALEMVLSGGKSRWNATLVIKLTDQGAAAPATAPAPPSHPAPGDAGCDRRDDARPPLTRSEGAENTTPQDARGTTSPVHAAAAGRMPQVRDGSGGGGDLRVPFPRWPWEDVRGGWRVSARLPDGTPISPELARTIALNAGVSALVLDADGIPLYLGDTVRFVTPGQRRALEALYDTCAFRECAVPARFCEVDHVLNWSEVHTTDIDLLAPCCSWHNRAKYRLVEQITMVRDTEGRWVYLIDRSRRRRRTRSATRARDP
ncbi:DUF222 domain-containing protein [Actinomadura scrupuli]|uniref:HNH endonuclease signature motif containing protein n=1 Tax=Actinomadura scrupuli TaxID=559629 RepID=UPI003D97E500